MPALGVNIDHVATLREARKGIEPEPLYAALLAESAGADSIVVHLREDRRHINEKDLCLLKKSVKSKLNLEMSIASDVVNIACKVGPDQATLVPEKRQELTTEGGLDVAANLGIIKKVSDKLKNSGIDVSLFIDPDKRQINAAKKIGIGTVELHTGCYANARNKKEQDKYFDQLNSAVRYALSKGLVVNAGHGLNYSNAARVAKIKGIKELNIGHAIISRSVFVGLDRAVRQMKELIS